MNGIQVTRETFFLITVHAEYTGNIFKLQSKDIPESTREMEKPMANQKASI